MTKKQKNISKILKIVLIILLFLTFFMMYSFDWIEKNFGLVSIDEILFHINVPLKGTNHNLIIDFLKNTLLPALIICIIGLIIIIKRKNIVIVKLKVFKYNFNLYFYNIVKVFFIIICLMSIKNSFQGFDNKFKIIKYIKDSSKVSTFIEDNYIDPKNVKITFDNNKRNLIYIYLESMESTYENAKVNDNIEENIISDLYDLANDNICFSDKDSCYKGGAIQISSVGWTIAGMVSQTSGIPLLLPIQGNDYTGYSSFLKGAYSLGDILEKEGYNQMVMVGSDIEFGGRKDYFKQHGNYKMKDINTAYKDKIVEDGRFVFWGFEDSYLFEYAKKELTKLSKKEEPFNFTMLTVNTHNPDGYFENEVCDEIYDNYYANAISCSSKQVYEFIKWIKEQDFYDNTTIIISGDHLSMSNNSVTSDESRRVYNVIINSAIEDNNSKNRLFSTLDMYPTTLASIGAKIEGNRLGLGVNLYSDELTILEKYGVDKVNDNIIAKSYFYNNYILYGKKKNN